MPEKAGGACFRSVKMGNRVWIGSTILLGMALREDAIVAAQAVATKDVPADVYK